MIPRPLPNKKRTSFILLALLLPGIAHAQTSVIFERTDITIASPPRDDKDKDQKPAHATLKYSVEARPQDALRLEYIHTLNTLTPDTGVLITMDAPGTDPLPPMKVYTPVDALFVADDGSVLQINPGIVLGDMTQEVHARGQVKGFLFLKNGEAVARGIHPKDIVTGKMFAVAPAMQN